MTEQATPTALGLRFHVTIDGKDSLGDWTKCEGLTVEYDLYEYKEGGNNDFVHRLPGRAKYQNLKLTRPVTKSTADVAAWLGTVKPDMDRTTAKVAVLDEGGTEIASWSFNGVYPVKWTGPTLDVGQNQVATEVLELAHTGFLVKG
jgi:phage tail-like protein